jgi:hypothetical protein
MIVHFVAPSPLYEKDPLLIDKIVKSIRAAGHTPTMSEEDHMTMVEMSIGILDQHEWEIMCDRHIELLEGSDIAIFEVSNKATFGAGYLAALALASGKPTLFLREKSSRKGSFTTGLRHPNLTRSIYIHENIEGVVIGFLERFKV